MIVGKNTYWLLLFLLSFALPLKAQRFVTQTGKAHFVSNAPLELIEASAEDLKGAVDISANTFAFTLDIRSFNGFNSALQKEHFNENYMESNRFPKAIFKGKIIDDVDLSRPGSYQVRAKGSLEIHGIVQERVIPCTLEVSDNQVLVSSQFTVPLTDHNISIPKLVYQKIADVIHVDIQARLAAVR